jgi:hypothetical protein
MFDERLPGAVLAPLARISGPGFPADRIVTTHAELWEASERLPGMADNLISQTATAGNFAHTSAFLETVDAAYQAAKELIEILAPPLDRTIAAEDAFYIAAGCIGILRHRDEFRLRPDSPATVADTCTAAFNSGLRASLERFKERGSEVLP